MPKRCLILLATLALPVGAMPADGPPQSKPPKKEEEKKRKPAKVYTDEDLKNAQGNVINLQATPDDGSKPAAGHDGSATAEPEAGAAGGRGGGTGREEGRSGEAGAGGASDAGRNEQSWREMARDRWAQLRSAEKQVADLQALIDQLTLDRDPNPPDLLDPSRLQKREAQKAKAQEELAAAQTTLQAAREALEDLRRRAGQAGVPSYWVEEPPAPRESDRG